GRVAAPEHRNHPQPRRGRAGSPLRHRAVQGGGLSLADMLFLLFELDGDRYALPARDVVEVLPLVALKQIPDAPPGVAGVMDYRGHAVPVLDLSALVAGRPAARRV